MIVSDVYADPRLRESLFALFDTVWGFLRGKEARAAALGFAWGDISTPFVVVEHGEVIAHAGLLEVPLVVAGKHVTVGSLHAVCVRAERRGQGLGRAVLTAALAAADQRYPAVVLASEKEALYAKFGFAPRPLHVFVARGAPGGGAARPLDLERAEVAALWVESMRTRVALSDRFSVIDRGAVNSFDALRTGSGHAPLWFDERLGVVYYARQDGARVVVDDVFAPGPVDGEALLAGLPLAGESVVFGFDPQHLGLAAQAVHAPYAPKDDRLQIRGELVDDDVPVSWPLYSFT